MLPDEYRRMNTYFRRLAASAARPFPHLRGPNTKGSVNAPDPKARVNFLIRPRTLEGNGTRSLECGQLESVVVVQGTLVDPADFLKGIDISDGKLRVVLGNRFSFSEIYAALGCGFKRQRATLAEQLMTGAYAPFCEGACRIVNDAIGDCKKEYGIVPRE